MAQLSQWFEVSFYLVNKKINSTKLPVGEPETYKCVLLDAENVLNPSIKLAEGTRPENLPIRFNYAYIPQFGRYYWVSDWTISGGCWVANLSVDALASWRGNIASENFYILRTSTRTNGALIDPVWGTNTNTLNNSYTYSPLLTPSNYCYIVGIVGKSGDYGMVNYYMMFTPQLQQLAGILFNINAAQYTTDEVSANLMAQLANPFDYITSVKWFPCKPDTDLVTFTNKVECGFLEFPIQGVAKLNDATMFLEMRTRIPYRNHPQYSTYGEFTNVSPYSQRFLDIQPWGRFELDTSVFKNCVEMELFIRVDFISGAAQLVINSYKAGNVYDTELYIGDAEVGCDTALGGVHTGGLAYIAGAAMNALAPVAETGNPLAVSSGLGALDIARNIWNSVTGKNSWQPSAAASQSAKNLSGIGDALQALGTTSAAKGSNGTRIAFERSIHYLTQFVYINDKDVASRGNAYMRNGQPSTLGTGYYQVLDGELNATTKVVDGRSYSAYGSELDTIRSFCETGFYYE